MVVVDFDRHRDRNDRRHFRPMGIDTVRPVRDRRDPRLFRRGRMPIRGTVGQITHMASISQPD